MSDLPKYRAVNRQPGGNMKTWLGDINSLVPDGYRILDIDVGEGVAVMSLSSAKYENITHLKDVIPSEVDGFLSEGWRITESYSKFVRMVKPDANV